MSQELKVIAEFYDLMIWMTQRTEKSPRHHRYGLGMTIENRLQHILALLLRAKYSKDKRAFLVEANLELEILRFQVRMAKDLRALAATSHEHAVKRMLDVGSQIGGWLKAQKV